MSCLQLGDARRSSFFFIFDDALVGAQFSLLRIAGRIPLLFPTYLITLLSRFEDESPLEVPSPSLVREIRSRIVLFLPEIRCTVRIGASLPPCMLNSSRSPINSPAGSVTLPSLPYPSRTNNSHGLPEHPFFSTRTPFHLVSVAILSTFFSSTVI